MSAPRTLLVAAGHDAMADTREAWQARITDDPSDEWCDELLARLRPGAHVVELGCGGGTDEARRPAERFRLTAIDLSCEQLRRARALVPGGLLLATLGASDLRGWTGEWLGRPTCVVGFEPATNRRLRAEAGLEPLRDELVTIGEPEGDGTSHWVLARR